MTKTTSTRESGRSGSARCQDGPLRAPGNAFGRGRAFALVIAILGLLTDGAQAATLVSATAGSSTDSGPSGTASASEPTPFGSHSATASLGLLNASSTVSFAGSGSDGGLVPRARFTDDLTITAPGATTGAGVLTARVRISGGPEYQQAASGPAVAQGMNVGYQVLTILAGGTGNLVDGTIIYGSSQVPPEAIINTVPAPGFVDVEFVFFFGFPREIGFEISARAGGNNTFDPPEDGTLSGSTNLTLVWEGITSIRDTNGNELLSEATVASASGTDWFGPLGPPAAVPLGPWLAPGLVVLLGAVGTLALGRLRRD